MRQALLETGLDDYVVSIAGKDEDTEVVDVDQGAAGTLSTSPRRRDRMKAAIRRHSHKHSG